jgi:hypothetical protein
VWARGGHPGVGRNYDRSSIQRPAEHDSSAHSRQEHRKQSVHLDVKPMCRRTSKRNQVCGGLDKFEVVLGEPALNEGTLAGMHKVPKLRG